MRVNLNSSLYYATPNPISIKAIGYVLGNAGLSGSHIADNHQPLRLIDDSVSVKGGDWLIVALSGSMEESAAD
jgi:hypothetical protein